MGSMTPMRVLRSVVLPEPLIPTMPKISPSRRSRLMLLRMVVPPNFTRMLLILMMMRSSDASRDSTIGAAGVSRFLNFIICSVERLRHMVGHAGRNHRHATPCGYPTALRPRSCGLPSRQGAEPGVQQPPLREEYQQRSEQQRHPQGNRNVLPRGRRDGEVRVLEVTLALGLGVGADGALRDVLQGFLVQLGHEAGADEAAAFLGPDADGVDHYLVLVGVPHRVVEREPHGVLAVREEDDSPGLLGAEQEVR